MSHTYLYPRPSVTVDCVVFCVDTSQIPALKVLLVKRADNPHKGKWALPGGFLEAKDDGSQGESLEEAAHRELVEETGLKVDYLEQLYTFGNPKRDPRGRVITVAYFALVREQTVKAGSDAKEAKWLSVASFCPDQQCLKTLAFDHDRILQAAIERLQAKVRYAPIGFNLLPSRFTLTQLQELYEAILMKRPLDKRNFRKKILAMGILLKAGLEDNTKPGPAAQMYRFDKTAYDGAVKKGFNFEL